MHYLRRLVVGASAAQSHGRDRRSVANRLFDLGVAQLTNVALPSGWRAPCHLSGDDVDPNALIPGLIECLGFAPIILGEIGGLGLLQQFGGPLMIHA
jgi:hypothetical protein